MSERASSSENRLTVFIDADACPVTRETLSTARRHKLPVVMIGNGTQNLERWTSREGVEAFCVSSGADAADFAIVERLSPHDICVTQDTGLAAMVLGRGAHAISPRGRVHSLATIDMDLEFRHAEKKFRRSGGRTRGPSVFTEEDREHFCAMFSRLISETLEQMKHDDQLAVESQTERSES